MSEDENKTSKNQSDSGSDGIDPSRKIQIKMEALEKLANPLNEGTLEAIKRLADQQTKLPEMYANKGLFPKISELLKAQNNTLRDSGLKALADQQNQLSEQLKKALASPLEELNKSLNTNFSEQIKQMIANDSPLHQPIDNSAFKAIEESRKELVRQKKIERQEEQKVNAAILNQEKFLADLVQSNMLLQQSVTALLNHTVTFETKKEEGASKQYQVSLWAFWAAVLSTVVAIGSLLYSIFFQAPVIVNASPPKVEAPVVNIDTSSIVNSLEQQTKILRRIDNKTRLQPIESPSNSQSGK